MDIGIDLGTANIVITKRRKGVVLNEPSVIAFNKRTERVVAVGEEAYKMEGRSPSYIAVVHPLQDGVISDDILTQALIREMIDVIAGAHLVKPRIVICVPSLITDVEKARDSRRSNEHRFAQSSFDSGAACRIARRRRFH